MGHIKHNIDVVVTGDYNTKGLEALRDLKRRMDEDNKGHYLIESEVCVNGTITFVFVPDGSKEGWAESNEADAFRQEMRDIAREHCKWDDCLYARFGGDDRHTQIDVAYGDGTQRFAGNDDDVEWGE